MSHLDSSSAGTNRLVLIQEEPKLEPQFKWSPYDRTLCEQIFMAADLAGVPISVDCYKALTRADKPKNKVDLMGVILAELGCADFLKDPKNRGIATFAGTLLIGSPTPALQIAGRQLIVLVGIAETDLPPKVAGQAVPSIQDANWNNVH